MSSTKENQVLNFPAGDAPGLQWRDRKGGERVPVWVAPKKAVAAGFTPRTVQLAADANPAEIAQACRRLQAAALEFTSQDQRIVTKFDGSVSSLLKLYQTDPLSSFRKVKWNSRETYTRALAILDREVGQRQLHSLGARDFHRWYAEFRKPAVEEGTERISRAHYLINQVRMLMNFGVLLEIADCVRLSTILSKMAFENSRPRTAILTAEMVKTFCSEARRQGRPSLALATAIQFDTGLRQKDVIGEWIQEEGKDRVHGLVNKLWTSGLVWGEHIDANLQLTKRTSKSRGDKVAEHDLTECEHVMHELQWLPPERKIGPVIIAESTRAPYTAKAFNLNWRLIARAAGLPDNVWNMDTRSGAITEASEANVDQEHLRSFATHNSIKMTQRYNRATKAKNVAVAKARAAHRKAGGEL